MWCLPALTEPVCTLGTAHSPGSHLPGDGKKPREQGDELEDLLWEVGGQHSHVEEVEDEEMDGLGDVGAVDLHLPLQLPKGLQCREAEAGDSADDHPWGAERGAEQAPGETALGPEDQGRTRERCNGVGRG